MSEQETRSFKEGDKFVANISVMDESEFSERFAEAGQIGQVVAVQDDDHPEAGGFRYAVVFWPSGIENFWDHAEIETKGRVLETGDPLLPSEDLWMAVQAVNMAIDFDNYNEDAGELILPAAGVQDIVARMETALGEPEHPLVDHDALSAAIGLFGEGRPATNDTVAFPISTVDAISAALGVAERMEPGFEAESAGMAI